MAHKVWTPNPAQAYVYFNNLEESPGVWSKTVYPAAQISLQAAYHSINIHANIKNKADRRLDQALDFLKRVMQSEQQKEKIAINKKINQLNNVISKIEKEDDNIQKIFQKDLNNLKNIIQLLHNNTDNKFYLQLIKAINIAVTGTEVYEQTLQQLLQQTTKQTSFNSSQYNNISAHIDTLINYYSRADAARYNQVEMLRLLTDTFIEKYCSQIINNYFQNNLLDSREIAGLVYVVQQELFLFLQNNATFKASIQDEQDFVNKYSLLEQELETFSKTVIGQRLQHNNNYILQILTENFENNTVSKQSNKINSHINQLRKAIGKTPTANAKLDTILSNIKVKKNLSSFGYDEIRTFILQNSGVYGVHTGTRNTATDSISLGSLTFVIENDNNFPNNNNNQNDIIRALNDLKKSLRPSRSSRAQSWEEFVANHNKKIAQTYSDIKAALNELSDIFIIHETSKDYTYKVRNKSELFEDFTGRRMAGESFLAQLQSLNVEKHTSIDLERIKILLYNTSKDTLGEQYKSSLEHYFAIFAGILMFDDFSQIALDANSENETIISTNPTHIHLYKLSSLYVPSSYILAETFNRMNQLSQGMEVLTDIGVTVEIKPPVLTYVPTTEDKMRETWEAMRKDASKNHINMHFGANFLNLIKQLSEI